MKLFNMIFVEKFLQKSFSWYKLTPLGHPIFSNFSLKEVSGFKKYLVFSLKEVSLKEVYIVSGSGERVTVIYSAKYKPMIIEKNRR